MKRIFNLLFCVCMLIGCQPQKSQADLQFEVYQHIKNQLMETVQFDNEYDFHIQLIFHKLAKDFRYDIIIDQPNVDMYDIIAMSYVDEDQQTMCPNIGIFDTDKMNLKKDFVDKSQGFYKGIQLSGTTSQKQNVRIYISYYTDEQRHQKIEKYIEVKNEIR